MISFRSHVCAIAERIVSATHSCAVKPGMRIDTKGFTLAGVLATPTSEQTRGRLDRTVSHPGVPSTSNASTTGTICAPELMAYCTTFSKNSGVHPNGVGLLETS